MSERRETVGETDLLDEPKTTVSHVAQWLKDFYFDHDEPEKNGTKFVEDLAYALEDDEPFGEEPSSILASWLQGIVKTMNGDHADYATAAARHTREQRELKELVTDQCVAITQLVYAVGIATLTPAMPDLTELITRTDKVAGS